MNVNNVMNTYNMSSLWNTINPSNKTISSTVPLVNNVDSSVQENYSSMNYFGQNTSSELQNIYKQVEPDYGIPVTYDKNGNFTMPTNSTLPTDGLNPSDSNIISLLNSNNSSSDISTENILSQYISIENGSFKPNLSSILSINPYNMYSTIDSLGNSQTQSVNNIINTSV